MLLKRTDASSTEVLVFLKDDIINLFDKTVTSEVLRAELYFSFDLQSPDQVKNAVAILERPVL